MFLLSFTLSDVRSFSFPSLFDTPVLLLLIIRFLVFRFAQKSFSQVSSSAETDSQAGKYYFTYSLAYMRQGLAECNHYTIIDQLSPAGL